MLSILHVLIYENQVKGEGGGGGGGGVGNRARSHSVIGASQLMQLQNSRYTGGHL